MIGGGLVVVLSRFFCPRPCFGSVWHNDVLVHENFVLKKGPLKPATIHVQNHSNPVAYRNIWFVEAK